jgi:glycerol uptake facilitator-like aquaporin
MTQWKCYSSELVGTAALLCAVIGSGIMSEQLASGNIASTSFANPAAAFGRMFTNSFAGISPADVPAFVLAEIIGGFLGVMLHTFLASENSQNNAPNSDKS